MKRVKTILAVLVITTGIFTVQSCSSDNEETTGTNDLFITFTLNGEEIDIRGDARVASAFSGVNLSINGNNNLPLTDPNYIRIALLIPDKNVEPGTYPFSGDVFTSGLYHCRIIVKGSTIQSLNSGNLVITSNTNKTIDGTFSGSATIGNETYAVTNGSFRAISDQ